MGKSDGERKSPMELFEAENDRIMKDAQTADKEARAKVADQEKKLGQVKARLAKAREQFERLRADYEKIEAEALEAERKRISAAAIKKEDVLKGSVSAEDYYRDGQTEGTIDAAARAATTKRLGELLGVVRSKGLEVLRLEVEEAEGERDLLYLSTYPASFMLERMRAQVKALEGRLCQGASAMPIWTELNEKRDALKRATGGAATGISWGPLDLAGVKRMRFEAGLPDSALPKLNEIIAEMESRPGSSVALQYLSVSMGSSENGLNVSVWIGNHERE